MNSRRGAIPVRWFALTAVAATVGMAAPVHAGAIAYETPQIVDFDFVPNGPDETLQFNQFDDQGGTRILQEVIIAIEGSITARITVENASEITAQFTLAVAEGAMDASMGGFDMPSMTLSNSVFGPTLAPSDGILDSGPDFHDFGTFGATDSDSVLLTSPPDDLSQFIGTGTVDAVVAALAGFSVQGPTDTRVVIDDVRASGRMTVTYGFQTAVVPVPPAAGLGAAGLALVAWRRKRKQG